MLRTVDRAMASITREFEKVAAMELVDLSAGWSKAEQYLYAIRRSAQAEDDRHLYGAPLRPAGLLRTPTAVY